MYPGLSGFEGEWVAVRVHKADGTHQSGGLFILFAAGCPEQVIFLPVTEEYGFAFIHIHQVDIHQGIGIAVMLGKQNDDILILSECSRSVDLTAWTKVMPSPLSCQRVYAPDAGSYCQTTWFNRATGYQIWVAGRPPSGYCGSKTHSAQAFGRHAEFAAVVFRQRAQVCHLDGTAAFTVIIRAEDVGKVAQLGCHAGISGSHHQEAVIQSADTFIGQTAGPDGTDGRIADLRCGCGGRTRSPALR